MKQKNIWEILGIAATSDRSQIRKAYAAKAKAVHPEEHPEAFMKLQNAYQQALSLAKKSSDHTQKRQDHPILKDDKPPEQSDVTQALETILIQKQTPSNANDRDENAVRMKTYFTQANAKYREDQQALMAQTIQKMEMQFCQAKGSNQEWNAIFKQKGFREIAIQPEFMNALCDAIQKMGIIPFHAIAALSFYYQKLQENTPDETVSFAMINTELDHQLKMFNETSRRRGNRRLTMIYIGLFLFMSVISIAYRQPFFIGAYFFVTVIFCYSYLLQKAKDDTKKQKRLHFALIVFIIIYMLVMMIVTIQFTST